MRKCAMCRERAATWACQPLGPDDGPTFTTLGAHYRGFAALACCDACKARVQAGESVTFTHRRQPYVLSGGVAYASPF